MIIIVNSEIHCRLDRYLRRLYSTLTQGVLEKALRIGKVKVNKAKAQASLRVIQGDEIFLDDSLNLLSINDNSNAVYSEAAIKLSKKILKNYLIYENKYFIAINKPAGISVQGGSKINLSINDALNYLNQQGGNFRLVHRLDKDTSGILLIAKDYSSSTILARAFREKLIQKIYIAIVNGKPLKDCGEISAVIGKKKGVAYEIVDLDNENGKLAVTQYKILKSLKEGLSLIEFMPITGRMHQLRFHAKLLGCPILGDSKYGSTQVIHSQHMLLHAKSITIPKEVFGEEISINTEIPNYFKF